MFLYHAVHDQATEIRDVDRLVQTYRRDGVEVRYRRIRVGEHMIVPVRGAPGVLRFLADRFAVATHDARGAGPRGPLAPRDGGLGTHSPGDRRRLR
jgi:hypothetical protein